MSSPGLQMANGDEMTSARGSFYREHRAEQSTVDRRSGPGRIWFSS